MLRASLSLLVASLLPAYASGMPVYDHSPQISNPSGLYPSSRSSSTPRPLVIWHGLGDSYNSPGMLQFIEMVKEVKPGIFIHSVYLDEDQDKDRQAGFYGNVNDQVELVSQQLALIPELQVEGGFDAMGFSQGGQFLRAYVERYNSPPVHNLLTFGSQHMGISDIPLCRPFDVLCQIARRATKSGVYGRWPQENLVQAQYFRDPSNLDTYLAVNNFLADINNELPSYPSSSVSSPRPDEGRSRNETYAQNLASLNALVLVMFTEDKTVVPKETSWFGSETVEDSFQSSSRHSGSDRNRPQHPFSSPSRLRTREIIPMREQPLYIDDWIGLRALDEKGGVVFETCQGEHMQMTDCWETLVGEWVGK